MSINPEALKKEYEEMFTRCVEEGLVPLQGVHIKEEKGGGVGQFLMTPTLSRLRTLTRDPFPYLGGGTKAAMNRWTEEEKEHAEIYKLVQRDFSNKKRKNVDFIVEYVKQLLDGTIIGFLPPPILWFQRDDIVVTDNFIAVRRDAYPHVIDGSTRVAAVHRLARDKEYASKLDQFSLPVIAIYGEELDTDAAGQVFCDVNWKAIPVDPSLAKSLDKRDIHSKLARTVEDSIPMLVGRVSARRQLTATDKALFTRYAVFQSVRCFTEGIEALAKSFEARNLTDENTSEVTGKTLDFWRELTDAFGSEWDEPESREKYLHIQAPVMKAISAYAHSAYFPTVDQSKKRAIFDLIRSVDWNRANDGWLGIATRKGSKGALLINNDSAVREIAKLLANEPDRLPKKANVSTVAA